MTACKPPSSFETYQPGSIPEIFQLIGTLGKKLNHLQEQTLKVSGLTPPQFVILNLLNERDERPFKDLADCLSCTRPTITGIVDTLEKKELVKRINNDEDRRSMLVKLTPKGKMVFQRTFPLLGESFGCCCEGLTQNESNQLSQLLKKLDSSLSD